MASTADFVEFVREQIRGTGHITYKKMFGEYMVYVNAKPVILVCDNTVYVKPLDCIAHLMQCAQRAIPYKGAKERYVLDIDDSELSKQVVVLLEKVTSIPKKKKEI